MRAPFRNGPSFQLRKLTARLVLILDHPSAPRLLLCPLRRQLQTNNLFLRVLLRIYSPGVDPPNTYM